MDTWALGIIAVSIILYFVSKKHQFFILTTGVGLGLLIGALWATAIITDALGG